MMEQQLKKKKTDQGVILISDAEYPAYFVAALVCTLDTVNQDKRWYQYWCGRLRSVTSNAICGIGGEWFLLDQKRITIACITHVPTNSGIVNPVSEIGQLLQKYNLNHGTCTDSEPEIFYLVDACQVRLSILSL